MATKIEVRIYGASNLHFLEPNGTLPSYLFRAHINLVGVNDPGVIVQLDSTAQSVGLPKSAVVKQKNSNPLWNKAFYFDTTDLMGSTLTVKVIDTNDFEQQAILGKVEIPLNLLSSVQNGVEVKHLHPLQTGGEIEVGLLPTHGVETFGSSPSSAAPPAQQEPEFKRAQTVGPFALKKKTGPVRGVVQYPPQDLQRIFPHLARGTYGVVFRGKVRGSHEYVVIKDMEIQNQNSVQEWQKEIDIMARTKSPYIAEVYGFSNQGNVLTIVMEFMCNGDLFGILHKKSDKHPLSLIQRMRMARHSALGLQVLHSKGFLHRDIKSMNILVSEDYTCKMTDFGCSKMVGEGQIFNTVNTGTPLWMAPEVKLGTYGFPSDIYSLGLVLYEIFQKKLPDYDPNTQRTSVPSTFQSAPVVLPCLNPNPQGRPTIDQVIQKLEMLIRGIVSAVHKVLPPEEAAAVAQIQDKLLKEAVAQAHPLDPVEAEQAALYQHMQAKSMEDADGLCLAAGISVGETTHPKPSLADSHPAPHAPQTHPMPQLGPNINNGEFLTPAPPVGGQPLSESKRRAPPHHAESKKVSSGDPHIIIVGANHLKPADLNGFSDPYAKIILNGIYHKTPIIKKTLDPVWNFKIPIPPSLKVADFQVDVWDWDAIGSHDYLGYACCMGLDVTQPADMWLELLPRSKKDKKITGKIHVKVIP